jgi:hypothetical protein
VLPSVPFAAMLMLPWHCVGGSLKCVIFASSTSTGAAGPAVSILRRPSAPADTFPSSSSPVAIFTLIGAKNNSGDRELHQRIELYEAGFRKFRERDFSQARVLFSQFLEFYPEDALAKMYLERALEYEREPPDKSWNAVEVFKKK